MIKELVDKYITKGNNYRNAQNLAAEEIILTKIASSPLVEHVTLKGGIVMYNLTKNNRRVTQDIDFDLIRYSISNTSIEQFIHKLNSPSDGLVVSIVGKIEQLHQEDYQGVRVNILITDKDNTKLRIKLDIGVHTYFAIEQSKLAFSFNSDNSKVYIKVNPCEQIFVEKLLSLARLGPISTRYKDIYDIYYFINNSLLDKYKVKEILELFFKESKRKPNDYFELLSSITDTLNNEQFMNDIIHPSSRWIDIEYNSIKDAIITYIAEL